MVYPWAAKCLSDETTSASTLITFTTKCNKTWLKSRREMKGYQIHSGIKHNTNYEFRNRACFTNRNHWVNNSHYQTNTSQGIINCKETETFTKKPKLAKLLRGLKPTLVSYNEKSPLVLLRVSNGKFSAFWVLFCGIAELVNGYFFLP